MKIEILFQKHHKITYILKIQITFKEFLLKFDGENDSLKKLNIYHRNFRNVMKFPLKLIKIFI